MRKIKIDVWEEIIHCKNNDGTGGKTVCLLCDDKLRTIAVGFAICSNTDNYDRVKGEKIAKGRAIKALLTGKPIITRVGKVFYISYRSWRGV